MGRLSKHLGLGEPLVIDGDEFIIKPLNIEHLPLFFKVMKAFSGASEEGSTDDVFKNLDDEGSNAVKDIIEMTVDLSLPEEPEEERKQFGLKYMSVLLNKIMEINSCNVTDDNSRKAKFLNGVKDKQKKNDGLAPKP